MYECVVLHLTVVTTRAAPLTSGKIPQRKAERCTLTTPSDPFAVLFVRTHQQPLLIILVPPHVVITHVTQHAQVLLQGSLVRSGPSPYFRMHLCLGWTVLGVVT